MKTIEIIAKLNPCYEGAEYLRKYKTLETAWKHCPRGDWMLWLAAKVKVPIKTLTLAKGLCANTARHLMKDERSIAAVDAALSFGRGEITEKEPAAAAYAAYAAAAAAQRANQQQTADICREILTKTVMEAAERISEW